MFPLLTERQESILGLVVRHYMRRATLSDTSKLVKQSGLDVSSATVRNELAALGDMGYLAQLHTSAGRIPTEWAIATLSRSYWASFACQ